MMISPRREVQWEDLHVANLRTRLHDSLNGSRDQRYLYRLVSLLLMAEGIAPQRLAEMLGESDRTLERWRRLYLEEGVDALREESSPGRPPKLSRDQLASLRSELARPPRLLGYDADRWRGRLLQEHLRELYGVEISLRQCQRLLKQFRQQQQLRTPTAVEPRQEQAEGP